ncbi:major facilitator superfamily domain-containing protein 10 isoform 4-T6 [Synchiropus picturatus]
MTEPPDSVTIYGCVCFSEIIVTEQRMSTTGMSDEESLKHSTKIIKVVFVTLLLDLLGFTLILPLLPSILDHYAQNEDGIYRSMQNIVDLFREAVGIPLAKKYNSVLFGVRLIPFGRNFVRSLRQKTPAYLGHTVTRSTEPPTKERMRRLQVLGLVYFCYLFLFCGLEFSLSFLTHQRFHFTSMQQGKMFFFIGILMALIQGGYARRMKPGQHIQAVSMAITTLIPAFILIGLSWNLTMLYAGLALYSFAAAVVVPCLSTLVADHGSVNQKGTVMGILRSLGSLARAMGPIVSSSVYWIAGAQTCFLLTAASFVVPLVLLKSIGRAEEGHKD